MGQPDHPDRRLITTGGAGGELWPYIEARLVPHIGKAPLASIDQLRLKRLRSALAKDYSRATVKLTMAYAGMIVRAAYASGRIGRDPTAPSRAEGPRR
jgi:hypothetical protein